MSFVGDLQTNYAEVRKRLFRPTKFAVKPERPAFPPFPDFDKPVSPPPQPPRESLLEYWRRVQREALVPKPPSVKAIIKSVAEFYHVDPAEIVSNRRQREIVIPRHVAMYFAKRRTPMSLPQIGMRFGGRDHSTVLYAVSQVALKRGQDREFDLLMAKLAEKLEEDCGSTKPPEVSTSDQGGSSQ